jgi:hypothetical protein
MEIVVVLMRPAATEVTVTLDGALGVPPVAPPLVPPPLQLIRPVAAIASKARISSTEQRFLNAPSRAAARERSNIERKATLANHDRGTGREFTGHLYGVSWELGVPGAVLIVSTMPTPEALPAGITAGLTVQDPPVNEADTAHVRFTSLGTRASDGPVSSFRSTVALLPGETCTVPGVSGATLKSTLINGTLPAVARPGVDALTE